LPKKEGEKMNPRNRDRKKYKELNRMCFEAQELFNTASEAVNEAKTVFDN
jgi:ribosomal protein S30